MENSWNREASLSLCGRCGGQFPQIETLPVKAILAPQRQGRSFLPSRWNNCASPSRTSLSACMYSPTDETSRRMQRNAAPLCKDSPVNEGDCASLFVPHCAPEHIFDLHARWRQRGKKWLWYEEPILKVVTHPVHDVLPHDVMTSKSDLTFPFLSFHNSAHTWHPGHKPW
jgi:hypothetical protein